jgi:quercetin dioxygenase-like cupin family protein
MLNINDLPERELIPGFFGRFIHGEKSTLTLWRIKKGSSFATHQHEHEQTSFIQSGELSMRIGTEDLIFRAGDFHVIPSNVPHSAIALTDVEVIDFFSPARDDYR